MKQCQLFFLTALCFFLNQEFVVAQTTYVTPGVSVSPTMQPTSQQSLQVEMSEKSQVVQQVSTLGHDEMIGHIDWENKIVYAVGDGAPPKDAINPAQARARAKRAAIDEAYARLLEAVQEVQVDANSTTRNFINE
ncbi:MAG: hypothetical protein PHS86_00755, partial [Syntrophaceae bacterium]|nr:hypothetical protein [Syntrophaceae bacterium]